MKRLILPVLLTVVSAYSGAYAQGLSDFSHQAADRNAAVTHRMGEVTRADGGGVEVGYIPSNDAIYPYDGMAVNQDLRVGVCVRIPADKIAAYVGAKVTSLRAGWSELNATPEVDFFLAESLDGAPLTTGKATVAFGWNNLVFDTPYEIPSETKDIYIGYYVDMKAGEFCIPESLYGTRYPDSHYTCRLDEDEDGKHKWYNMSQDCGVFFINCMVLAEGEQFQNIVLPTSVMEQEVVLLGELSTARLSITNQGMNDVSNMKLKYECGELTGEYLIDFKDKPIPAGKSVTLYAPIKPLASGVNKVSVAEVNGVANKMMEKAVEYNLLVVDQATSDAHPHRPVVEVWIGENNHLTPMYMDQLFYPGLVNYKDRLTVLTRHVEDLYSMGDDEERELNIDLYGGNINKAGYPAMGVDRSYYPTNLVAEKYGPLHGVFYPDYSFYAYDPALLTPAFASVALTPVYDATQGKLVIKAEGDVVSGILPEGEKLNLCVYVVENNVQSPNQEFPDDDGKTIANYPDGIFTHHNVIRWQGGSLYGDPVDFGTFSKDYTVELDPEWNVENLRVVAMLNRGKNADPFKMQIINSAEAGVTNGAFVAGVNADMPTVYVESGKLMVKGAYDSVKVYDMTGAAVDASHLGRGVHLVEVKSGAQRHIVKILVK